MAIYYKIDSTLIDETLYNFPVGINIAAATGFLSGKGADDWKYLKATVNNIECPIEVVLWDYSAGTAQIWVAVVEISATVDTIIKLQYIETDNSVGSTSDLTCDFTAMTVGGPADQRVWRKCQFHPQIKARGAVEEIEAGGYAIGEFPLTSGGQEINYLHSHIAFHTDFSFEFEVDLTDASPTSLFYFYLARSYYDRMQIGMSGGTSIYFAAINNNSHLSGSPQSASISAPTSIKFKIERSSGSVNGYYDVGAGWVSLGATITNNDDAMIPTWIAGEANGGSTTSKVRLVSCTLNSATTISGMVGRAATTGNNSGNVWGPEVIVACHFANDPSTQINNSAENRSHFSQAGTLVAGDLIEPTGAFGTAIDFNGSSQYAIQNEIALILDCFGTNVIDLSCAFLGQRDGNSSDSVWQFIGPSSGGLMKFWLANAQFLLSVSSAISSAETNYLCTGSVPYGQPNNIGARYREASNEIDFYDEGEKVNTVGSVNTALFSSGARFTIGQEYDSVATPSDHYDGWMSELIISYIDRSDAWFKAIKSVVAGELLSQYYPLSITHTVPAQSVALTDFPVRVFIPAVSSFLENMGADDWKYLHATVGGEECYAEVEDWNTTDDTAIVWVKTDLSASAETVITLSFGANNYERIITSAEVFDDFTGANGSDPDSLKWEKSNTIGTDYLDIQNNALNYTSPGDNANHASDILYKGWFNGAFDVQIDWTVSVLGTPDDSYNYAPAFRVKDGSTSIAIIDRNKSSLGDKYRIYGTDHAEAYIATSDVTGKFRFTRTSAGEIKAFYWNGSNWVWDGDTNGVVLVNANTNNVSIQIYFEQENSAVVDVSVDNFQINSCDGISGYIGEAGEYQVRNVWSNFIATLHLDADAEDTSPSEISITANGSPAYADDGIFKHIVFDGSDDYLAVPLNVTGDFTLAFWHYRPSQPGTWFGYICRNLSSAAYQGIGIGPSPNFFQLDFDTATTNNFNVTEPIETGRWYRIVVRRTGAYVEVFYDGDTTPKGADTLDSEVFQLAVIGYRPVYGNNYPTNMSDFFIINEAVDDSWIAADYKAFFSGQLGVTLFKSITFQTDITKIESDLTNFPLKIVLGSDFMSDLLSTDWKYCHVTLDGEELYTEVERWDITNGVAVLHSRVPLLTSATAQFIEVEITDVNNYDRVIYEAEVFDDFTGADDDLPHFAKWEITQANPIIKSNALYGYVNNAIDSVVSQIAFTGDFEVEVDYDVQSAPAAGIWEMKIVVSDEDVATGSLSNAAQIVRGYTPDSDSGSDNCLYVNMKTATVWGTGEYDSADQDSGKFKVNRTGDILSFYYKETGDADWTLLDTRDISAWAATDPLYIHLAFRSNSASVTMYGAWDNFTINFADSVTGYIGEAGELAAQGVWDPYLYQIVYNLAQDPSGGASAVKDSTANENHATSAGTMLTEDLVAGNDGYALDFDGSDDYLTSDDATPVSGSNKRTMLAIIKTTDNVNEKQIMSYGALATGDHYGLEILGSDVLRLALWGGNVAWDGVYADGEYHVVIVTMRGSTYLTNECWMDGVELAVNSSSAVTITTVSNLMVIGARTIDHAIPWSGSIAAAMFLSDEVSDAWIKAITASLLNNVLSEYVPPSEGGGVFGKLLLGGLFKDITAAKIALNGAWKTLDSPKMCVSQQWKTLV